jgi:hypothetical protein
MCALDPTTVSAYGQASDPSSLALAEDISLSAVRTAIRREMKPSRMPLMLRQELLAIHVRVSERCRAEKASPAGCCASTICNQYARDEAESQPCAFWSES